MPIFISYSHSDEIITNKLAAHLVKKNTNVWVDTWELNVGDSILNKVQDAIQDSSALLVILSKASVESEWCKKEISAGLMKELDEKRVVVLPVIVEDCEIPVFLREKFYADLRTDFNFGFNQVLSAISKISNANQSRIDQDDGYIDWSVDWGLTNKLFHLKYTMVHSPISFKMTFLTQVFVFCNEIATKRYLMYENADLGWIGREMIAELLFHFGENENLHLILDSQSPKELKTKISDKKYDSEYEVIIESRKMGEDNGKDQLISISDCLIGIRNYIRTVSRKPSPDEILKIKKIVESAWNT